MKWVRPRFDAVCLDFDSTLSRLEGIDELAALAGVADKIAPLTAAAMDGRIPLDSIYAQRLDIIRPTRDAISWLAQRYIDETVPGAATTIDALHQAGVATYIVSGGLRAAILPFAEKFKIAPDRVYAVDVTFDAHGNFLDFDRGAALARPDGKAVICRELFGRHNALALVGDGITDVAARSAGAFVVGFGGVAVREAVRQAADHYVPGPGLSDVLDVLFEP